MFRRLWARCDLAFRVRLKFRAFAGMTKLRHALEGKKLPVYGKGENVRDWLFVEDHVRALIKIVSDGQLGETYNIGGRNERSNLEVVRTICKHLDELAPKSFLHEELIEFVSDRPGHDLRYAIDATKLETRLNWRAQENFETGILKTIQWYLDNPDWWGPLRSGVYGGDRLGLLNKAPSK